jgi:putative membrane protein
MFLGMFVFWGALVVLAVALLRRGADDRDGAPSAPPFGVAPPFGSWEPRIGAGPRASRAREILAERFARGEIDADDYRARLAELDRTGQ